MRATPSSDASREGAIRDSPRVLRRSAHARALCAPAPARSARTSVRSTNMRPGTRIAEKPGAKW